MSAVSLALRPADEVGIEYVETLLRRNDLPAADVSSKPDCFYVGYDAGGVGDVDAADAGTAAHAAADAGTAADASTAAAHSDDAEDARDGADEDTPVCVGGLERHASTALLRSVVVEESVRGEGYGSLLCDRLESRARADGVESIYLLTTTAADFFADRGYERIERDEAPPAIRETTEFDDLCPATATCMRKSL